MNWAISRLRPQKVFFFQVKATLILYVAYLILNFYLIPITALIFSVAFGTGDGQVTASVGNEYPNFLYQVIISWYFWLFYFTPFIGVILSLVLWKKKPRASWWFYISALAMTTLLEEQVLFSPGDFPGEVLEWLLVLVPPFLIVVAIWLRYLSDSERAIDTKKL